MSVDESQLKDFLLDSGLVSRADVYAASKEAGEKEKSVGEILVNEGKLSSDDLRRIQSFMLGIPLVTLSDDSFNFETLSLIPEPIARGQSVIAFKRSGGTLEVALLSLDALEALGFIREEYGLKILPRFTDEASMKRALIAYQKGLKHVFGDTIQKESSLLRSKGSGSDAAPARIVDAILKHAILQNVSDIHFEPKGTELLVRYRIDGRLHDAMILPSEAAEAVAAQLKILAGLSIDAKETVQHGRFAVETGADRVSVSISVLPTASGEKTTVRLVRHGLSGFTLETLGFHGEQLERLHRALRRQKGMIIVAGPRGSGKTTALYTMLDIVNTPRVSIGTIEHSIEYRLPQVNHTSPREDLGFSVLHGLRALMRQDHDVIMIGALEGDDTASLAIHAALSGRLILSGLSQDGAAAGLSHILSMNVDAFSAVGAMHAVVSGRLVARLTGGVAPYILPPELYARLSESADMPKILKALKDENIVSSDADWGNIFFHRSASSDKISDPKIGIYEVLTMTPSVRELLRTGAASKEIEAQARKEGMLTMLEDGIFKAAAGMTTLEEVEGAVL